MKMRGRAKICHRTALSAAAAKQRIYQKGPPRVRACELLYIIFYIYTYIYIYTVVKKRTREQIPKAMRENTAPGTAMGSPIGAGSAVFAKACETFIIAGCPRGNKFLNFCAQARLQGPPWGAPQEPGTQIFQKRFRNLILPAISERK